jgi:CopG family nickel-responsive transcriptional regulator
MQRLAIGLADENAEALDAFIAGRGYDNRSEAVRNLLHPGLRDAACGQDPALPCVAAISYLCDHHERDLGHRLTEAQHAHHELGVATVHLHLDHHQCVEEALLRGRRRRCAALPRR